MNLKPFIGRVLIGMAFLFVIGVGSVNAATIKINHGNIYTKFTSRGLQKSKKVKNVNLKIKKRATIKNKNQNVNVEYGISKKVRGWIYTPVTRSIANFAANSNINHYKTFKPAYLYLPNVSEVTDLSLYKDLQTSTLQSASSKRISRALNRTYQVKYGGKKDSRLAFQIMRGRRTYYLVNPINRINGVNLLVPYNSYLNPYESKDADGNYKIMSIYSPNSKHVILNPQIKKRVTGKYGEFKDGVVWEDITQPNYLNGRLISDYRNQMYQYNLSQHRWNKINF